jgi:hypothetical protein
MSLNIYFFKAADESIETSQQAVRASSLLVSLVPSLNQKPKIQSQLPGNIYS